MTEEQRKFLADCLKHYRNDLTGDILPFWFRHGFDRENGGVYTYLDRDGSIYDTTKSVWFQGRFAYLCSLAYNAGVKDDILLHAAKSTLDFIEKYCIDRDGRMFFEVTAQGAPLRKRRYVFSECFAAIAMAEYAGASGEKNYAQKALTLFGQIRKMLSNGSLMPKYEIPMRGHSMVMIMMNVAKCIAKHIYDPLLDIQIEESVKALQDWFLHPEYRALLETVGPQGEFIDSSMGRLINPGHGVETAWFLMEIAEMRNDRHWVELATTILDYSWEWGWDETCGGIINFRDCKGFPVQDYSQDMKFWWPQCEAIIATLYAYRLTGDNRYLEKHRMIHAYTYEKFPDPEFGEWYGYLHRDGRVAIPAKGTLFKGPFHIPRMMIYAAQLCEQILEPVKIQI